MKKTCLLLLFVVVNTLHGQDKFVFNESGLTPEFVTDSIKGQSKTDLKNKTLEWIEKTNQKGKVILDNKTNKEYVRLTHIENNAFNEGKNYYHVKYIIKLSFKDEFYKLEPLKIQKKLNSKYDMGWENIEIKNGEKFFKKGKVIKKTKSFVSNIPEILNDLNLSLGNYIQLNP